MTEKTVDSPTPISEPAAKIASGGRGVVGALLMTTVLLAVLATVVYLYAWPWLTDQWQRLAQIEQQLVDVSLQEDHGRKCWLI